MKQDDEYHFSENEPQDVFGSGSSSGMGGGGSSKNRNILIIVGVIIVILAVYKLLGLFFSSEVKKESPPPKPGVQVPIQTVLPPTPAPTPVVDTSQQTAMNARIDKLEDAISQLTNSLSDAGSKINDLSNTLQTLSNEITQQQAQISEIQASLVKPKVVKPRHPIVRTVYYIQSMLPGRAWIKSSNESTMTVKVGDYLHGYGIIQVIDTTQGIIQTSSGVIIGYSPQDS